MADTTRRNLLAGGTALAVTTAAAPPPGPDARLLHLCNTYLATAGTLELNMLAARSTVDPSWHTAVAISRVPARTSEGIQAKARVVQRYLQDAYGNPEPRFCADAEMATMWSLVSDVLGEA